MDINCPTAGSTQRPVKHNDLYRAIDNVDSVIQSLADLKRKITDNPNAAKEPVNPAPPIQSPALVEVLERGSAMLRDKVDTAHQIISEIEEMLF